MAVAQYFVERLTAHSDVWMIKFDDEEYGPYKSQSEAVLCGYRWIARNRVRASSGTATSTYSAHSRSASVI